MKFNWHHVLEELMETNSCAMTVGGDNPTAMKDFVLDMQNRVNELKNSDLMQDAKSKINGKRMQSMLEVICYIMNNKKKGTGWILPSIHGQRNGCKS
ncbi:hypothetical protein IHE45_13G093200 [Dioscorea alata]|uniref:Uncharacterized protein n=1 Tax=Dioscorea alata TaxID=55571 RepID=A0ACB7UZX2_DIOAL|nr:hypothetical protein IHE45_13G093200 [Dioscorea alata]